MVITVPAGTTPVEISFGGFMYNSAAARAPQLRLTDLANTVIDSAGETIAVANDLTEGFRTRVLPPSAADRTFKLRLMADASSGAGTGHSFGYDNGVGGCWPVTLKATLA
jgi:hypothetical protein